MSSLARPRQVTVAAGVALVGCVLLVVALFDAMSQVRSVETRNAIASFLSTPPGDGLGFTVPQVVDFLRVLVLFNGALAATAAVLAVYVFQRHNPARVGLTVAAAILVLTAPFSGGALPFLVAFGAAMLWTRPARDWFAGREPEPAGDARLATEEGRRPDDERPGPAPYPFGEPPGTPGYPGTPPSGQPPYPQGGQPAYPQYSQPQYSHPQYPPGYPAYPPPGPGRRPPGVVVAAVLTWVFAGLTGFVYLLLVAALVFARDELVDAIQRDSTFASLDISTDTLLAAMWVMSAVAIVWSLAAMVLAFLAFRGQNWARITLAVSAGVAFLACFAGLPFSALNLLAAIATVILLFVGGANAWYSRRPGAPPPPPRQQQPW